jgi:hypothetical protein
MGEVATLVTTPVITENEAHHILFDTAADLIWGPSLGSAPE